MIGLLVEGLAILLLAVGAVVLILALAAGVVMLLTSLRVLRKAHKVVGWLGWPKPEKPKSRKG